MLASFLSIEIREIFQQIDQASATGQGSFATPFRIMLGRDITMRAKRKSARSSRCQKSRDLRTISTILPTRWPGYFMPPGFVANPKHRVVQLFGKTHSYRCFAGSQSHYSDCRKLLRRKNKTHLTTLVVSVFAQQHPSCTIPKRRMAHGHFGLLGELVGDQTGRGHSDEDESNLVLIGRRSWCKSQRAFPRWPPHRASWPRRHPGMFKGVALLAEYLANEVEALCPLFRPCLLSRL